MKRFDVIDAHVHVGLEAFRIQCALKKLPFSLENPTEACLSLMEKSGCAGAFALPIPGDDFPPDATNAYLEKAEEASDGKLFPFCRWDDAFVENICTTFYGIKMHKVYETYEKRKLPFVYRVMEFYQKPLILHAEFKNKIGQIKNILKEAPRLQIILAHMGRGHIHTSEGVLENLREFQAQENIMFETSTMDDLDVIAQACEIVGSHRIMYGSDYPFEKEMEYGCGAARIQAAPLIGKEDKENILYGTAKRLIEKNTRYRNYVVPCRDCYREELLAGIGQLGEDDKRFLAWDKKANLIKRLIHTSSQHIFLLLQDGNVAGFFRESGRPDGESFLEELAIFPKYRGRGLSKLALRFYQHMFPKHSAKTLAKNERMNAIFAKGNYQKKDGIRIIYWTYTGGAM